MERVVGMEQLRLRLGEYVDRAEKGEVMIISSRSKPRGVLIGYHYFKELRKLAEKAKQWELKAILDEMRQRGENAGLTEEDVLAEVEEVRRCGR